MSDLRDPLLLSLKIAAVATVVVALVGVPLAYAFSRWRFPGRSLLEAVVIAPLVLPPTVVGYLLTMGVGARTPVGGWLRAAFDHALIFHGHGAVLAASVVALPMLFLPAKAAVASVERELEDAARQMGAGALQVFWHVSLP